jgi:outer membrane protein OmpA-like peptidoglycan-associated protein
MTRTRFHMLAPTTLAAVAALSACATIQPNQNIVAAQLRLSAAYNEKMTAERGQGDLANAKGALTSAQTDWDNGEKESTDHQLIMANTFIDLAETRGHQAQVEQDTVVLKNRAQIAAKNQTIADQSQLLAVQNQQIAEKDDQLSAARDQLRIYNMKITQLGATMVLDDVSFETGKSDLLSGGVNRMQALINYLHLSPDTRVRIEGFTDNVGGADYNR